MPNLPISGLGSSAANLASSDLLPVVQTAGVGPVKMTGLQLAAGLLSATTPIGSGPILSRGGSSTLQLGAADVASGAVAQTLQVQSNTGASTTGPNFTIKGSSGTTAGGSIIFQTHNGTAYATALTIASDKSATFGGNLISSGSTNGGLYLRGGSNATQYVELVGSNLGIYNSTPIQSFNQSGSKSIGVTSDCTIGWSNSTTAAYPHDTYLSRDNAGILALRNGANAQSFLVYNSYTDGSNYAAGRITWSGNQLYIGSIGAGTGVAGAVNIQSGNTIGWQFSTSGHLLAYADNTYDIGASGATRPRTIYVGTHVQVGSNVYSDGSLYMRSAATSGIRFYASADAVAVLNDYNSSGAIRLNFGGTTASFPALKRSSATLQVRLADDSGDAALQCGTATSGGTAFNVNGTGGNSIASITNTSTGTLLQVLNSTSNPLMTVTDTTTGTLFSVQSTTAATLFSVNDTTSGTLLAVTNSSSVDVFTVADTGSLTVAANATITSGASNIQYTDNRVLLNAGGTIGFGVFASGPALASTGVLQWANSALSTGGVTSDLILARDDSNKLALRNSTNAQTFRVYGSYTSATVYDRLSLTASSTEVVIAAETDTGNMDVTLTPAGTGNVKFGTHTGTTDTAISGYIEIKDAGGNVRKLAVIT